MTETMNRLSTFQLLNAVGHSCSHCASQKVLSVSVLMTVLCVCVCFRRQKSTESAGSDEEDVDELSLIDHKEIMSRITLKQEVRQPPLLTPCTAFRNPL